MGNLIVSCFARVFQEDLFSKYSMIQGSRVIRSNELKEMNYCLSKHFIHFIFGVIYLFLKSSTFCYKQLLILPHGGHERKKKMVSGNK